MRPSWQEACFCCSSDATLRIASSDSKGPIQRNRYPKLRVRLMGQFPIELVRSVAVGELNFALVTAPLLNADIIAVPFAQAPLYAALPENHPAVKNETLGLRD